MASRKRARGSTAHLAVLFALCIGTAAAGSLLNGASVRGHSLGLYGLGIVFELVLLGFCWLGARRSRGWLAALGLRWDGWGHVPADVASAIALALVALGAAAGIQTLIGEDPGVVADLAPRTRFELLVWICLSLMAGIAEELTFRGYLQGQLLARRESHIVAILVQAGAFALCHSYQGWRAAVGVLVLGLLFGTLASLRGNLRANVLAHVAIDVLAGCAMFARQ